MAESGIDNLFCRHLFGGPDGFGIQVYGVGNYTSYMYPGGLDIKVINVPD